MDKLGTKSLAQVPACDDFEVRPAVRLADDAAKTCGKCAHYSNVTNTRLTLCPHATKPRREDPQD